jgi:hypothetical protein
LHTSTMAAWLGAAPAAWLMTSAAAGDSGNADGET